MEQSLSPSSLPEREEKPVPPAAISTRGYATPTKNKNQNGHDKPRLFKQTTPPYRATPFSLSHALYWLAHYIGSNG